MTDALRLALGTLTVLRVPAPRRVDAAVAGRAMALAPLVGLLLGLTAAAVGALADVLGATPLLVATLVVVTIAWSSRGLHLDGLADTADGLGSGRRGAEALAVMSRSDIGPFGVVTLVLVLLAETAAFTQAWTAGRWTGAVAVVTAVVVGRAALPLLCRRGVRSAKSSGLGSAVAGSVGPPWLLVGLGSTTLVVGTAGYAADELPGAVVGVLALAIGLALAELTARRCVHRFGGVTGDVLGAAVELASAAGAVALAIGLT